jgi:hypothetical protein
MKIRYKLSSRIMMGAILLAGMCLGVALAIEYINEGKPSMIYITGLPFFLISLFGLVYYLRFNMCLTANALQQTGLFTTTIHFEDITAIEEYMGSYNIKGKNTSIRITTDLEHKEKFRDTLSLKLQDLHGVSDELFPGQRLSDDEYQHLINKAGVVLSSNKIAGGLYKTDKSIFTKHIHEQEKYYLLYIHFLHSFLNKGFIAHGKDISDFLLFQIDTERAEGIGAWVFSDDMEWLIGCDYDGEIFYKLNKLEG